MSGVTHQIEGEEHKLLDDISLDVERGEIVTIQGRSGSGKSTLLSFMGLLAKPSQGEVSIAGQQATNDQETARLRQSEIGFVFQNYSLLGTRTAVENVALPLLLSNKPKDAYRKSIEACQQVRLESKTQVRASKLSGGEQQRVAIARALVTQPSLILADEPTGALDERTSDQILDLMTKRCRETPVALIVVTHDPAIGAMGSRRLHLSRGVLEE